MDDPVPTLPANELLAAIASMDPTAAALGAEVLRRRRISGGDVQGWLVQLEKARLSLLSSFRRTRLAYIARDELGIPHPIDYD
jgi:hypothetical protein